MTTLQYTFFSGCHLFVCLVLGEDIQALVSTSERDIAAHSALTVCFGSPHIILVRSSLTADEPELFGIELGKVLDMKKPLIKTRHLRNQLKGNLMVRTQI